MLPIDQNPTLRQQAGNFTKFMRIKSQHIKQAPKTTIFPKLYAFGPAGVNINTIAFEKGGLRGVFKNGGAIYFFFSSATTLRDAECTGTVASRSE
jgi:hypothetical protein